MGTPPQPQNPPALQSNRWMVQRCERDTHGRWRSQLGWQRAVVRDDTRGASTNGPLPWDFVRPSVWASSLPGAGTPPSPANAFEIYATPPKRPRSWHEGRAGVGVFSVLGDRRTWFALGHSFQAELDGASPQGTSFAKCYQASTRLPKSAVPTELMLCAIATRQGGYHAVVSVSPSHHDSRPNGLRRLARRSYSEKFMPVVALTWISPMGAAACRFQRCLVVPAHFAAVATLSSAMSRLGETAVRHPPNPSAEQLFVADRNFLSEAHCGTLSQRRWCRNYFGQSRQFDTPFGE